MGKLAGQRRQPRHLKQRRVACCKLPASLGQDGRRPFLQGRRDEVAAVCLRTGIGDEDVARLNTPRIRRQARRDHTLCLELFDDRHSGIHISSRTGSALVITIGFAGASGATPRLRRAPPMTWANTGAATSPP